MAKSIAGNKAGHITNGDVLEDLGFSPDEIRETEMKMTIWRPLRAEVDARGLSQTEIARQLQMHQPDASLLLRGRLSLSLIHICDQSSHWQAAPSHNQVVRSNIWPAQES